MTDADIRNHRMANQLLATVSDRQPEDVVSYMGALQAQDYLGSLWAIALRTNSCTQDDVEKAIADRKIVRTWPMRRTLHFVSSADVHWMLALLAPRVIQSSLGRLKDLGLDAGIITKSADVLNRALTGGKIVTRKACYDVLEAAGISTGASRGIHILWRLGQEGILCFGPREGKQPTFVLLDEWLPKKKLMPREESIAELTSRYFTSHGPATVYDFSWWSGLTVSDVRTGIHLAKSGLQESEYGGKTYYMNRKITEKKSKKSVTLLPPFDEYIVSYKDRSAVLETAHNTFVNPGANGMMNPTVVVNGTVAGIWKRELKKKEVLFRLRYFTGHTAADHADLTEELSRYRVFLGLKKLSLKDF